LYECAQEPLRLHLASLLEDAAADIFDRYTRQLRTLDSPLLKDERSRTQCLTHARIILEDTIDELRAPPPVPGHRDVVGDIGATPAISEIHPSNWLPAAGVLFSCVMRALAPRLSAPDAAGHAVLLSVTVNAVLARALCGVADAYARHLLDRVHEAHLEERRRLSRELHDRIGHGISVAQRSLELHDIYQDSDPGRAAVRIRTAQQVLGDTIDVVRQVISDLRLFETVENLEKAIKLLLEQVAGPGLSGRVEVNGDEVWASPDVVEEVYLILREALRNVVAHADAVHVLVRIDVSRGELRAWVVDDGCGFDVAGTHHGGTGVLSMRERAALLGGILTLHSHPRQGTRLDLTVPLT
jgi:signal transduction histidine kinase